MNRYRTKSKEATAIQLKQPMKIGDMVAMTGDWLVDDGKSQFFMADDEFRATYELVIEGTFVPQRLPIHPFPDTYPGIGDTFPWPTNPQWPSGPIYWTSGPNFTQCAGTHFTSPYTGVEAQKAWEDGSFMMTRSGNDGKWSCINIPRCIDGQFHSFVTRFKMGDGKNAYTRCSKCGKESKEVQC